MAFHILTLGIPLLICHIASCCYPRTAPSQGTGNIQAIAIDSVQRGENDVSESSSVASEMELSAYQNGNIKPYSAVGLETLEFARKKLAEYPDIAPEQFGLVFAIYRSEESEPEYLPIPSSPLLHAPRNPEIARLVTLHLHVTSKKFEDLMKQNKENPWDSQEVINAADEYMKIAYAISNLTLDDLQPFTKWINRTKLEALMDPDSYQYKILRTYKLENLPQLLFAKRENRTYAQALTKQDSYLYRTFYYCTQAYHRIRGSSIDHAAAFYQEGTIQNSWNELYNDYCDRVRLYVDEEELRSEDNRSCDWTEKDTGVETFRSAPTFMPT